MSRPHEWPWPNPTRQDFELSNLTEPQDLQNVSPVEYAHDPVPKLAAYLVVPKDPFLPRWSVQGHALRTSAIRLYPRASRLPYRCNLDGVYESRFWRSGLEASTTLLRMLAADQSAGDFVVGNGVTMTQLSQKELRPGLEHRFCKASTYMYPFASEERAELLASSMVMMFLFDDKGEDTSDNTYRPFLEDFLKRLREDRLEAPSDSELQNHIDAVMQGFRRADSETGTAGHEVIEAMRQSFRRMRPEKKFQTLRQYLNFRHDNVGADYVLAAVKFSICSQVVIADPRLKTYLTLLKDHLAIVNDMASFDKEKRDFERDPNKPLINIVEVIQRLLSVADIDFAKALAYIYQGQTEASMERELQRLEAQEDLDADTWQYLQATYVCAAGNAFFSMTSSRYGGEAARIRCNSNGTISDPNRGDSEEDSKSAG